MSHSPITTQPQAGRLSSQRSWPVPAALPGTGELRGDLAKAAGWIINLAVAEWVIRRPARAKAQRRIRAATPAGASS